MLYEYKYTKLECGEPIECHLDFDEGEEGSREQGVQMEPDISPSMTLHNAYVKGVDIADVLAPSIIEEIEQAALEQRLS